MIFVVRHDDYGMKSNEKKPRVVPLEDVIATIIIILLLAVVMWVIHKFFTH